MWSVSSDVSFRADDQKTGSTAWGGGFPHTSEAAECPYRNDPYHQEIDRDVHDMLGKVLLVSHAEIKNTGG